MRNLGALWIAGLAAWHSVAAAQDTGMYVNFETPVHRPLVVAKLDGVDYLLVCNAPDNSVEIFRVSDNRFLLRVPVGQEPVGIVLRPRPLDGGGHRCYVANWLGDSITSFDLVPNPGGTVLIRAALGRTVRVGDEPIGIAVVPEIPTAPSTLPGGVLHEALVVTFSAQGAFGAFHPETLLPTAPEHGFRELLDTTGAKAIKDPRAILFAPATAIAPNVPFRIWILNFRGGNTPDVLFPEPYDFDLWASDDLDLSLLDEKATLPTIGELGSTNFNMTFAANGDLYVVGQFARNHEFPGGEDPITGPGESVAHDMVVNSTGFVTSALYRVRGDGDVELPLDLNFAGGGQSPTPVTQPTDVIVYGSGDPGTRLFVTGFNSDSVAMIEVGTGAPSSWTVTRINVETKVNPFTGANLGGAMMGPRAFALKASGTPHDPADRLFVYNRVDHSYWVLDPNVNPSQPSRALRGLFKLRFDPTPAHVKTGRKFLYSSRLSGGGNVSCASCHVDGDSDFLAWNLSGGGAIPGEGAGLPGALGPNPAVKGPMMTQTLRGLVNYEIEDDAVQDTFFSNRPYHFRGDKGLFEHFNAAFVNLMAIDDPFFTDPNDGANNKGIDDASMKQYRDFVFSIHYPPNPNQPLDRTYSGSFWLDPLNPPTNPNEQRAQLNDPTIGVGAQRGLKLFHIQGSSQPLDVDRDGTIDVKASCVHCHSLPDGSNHRLSLSFFYVESSLESQFIETTQLRGMALKEKRLIRADENGELTTLPPGSIGGAVTGEFGLNHTGKTTLATSKNATQAVRHGSESIRGFNEQFVGGGPPFVVTSGDMDDVSEFLRQLDTGVAPMVGFTGTADLARFGADPGGVNAEIAALETEAQRGNAGLAVYARISGVDHGFFHDLRSPATPYREEGKVGAPIGPLKRSSLLAFVDPSIGTNAPDNLLIWHATPVGVERRVASQRGGLPPKLAPLVPTGIVLLASPAPVANKFISMMTVNWTDLVAVDYHFLVGPKFKSAQSRAVLQTSLVAHAGSATPPGFGLTELRHEPPRRFRVTGAKITPGARLRLWAPSPADIATATATTPPTTVPDSTDNPWRFDLPIYAVVGSSVVVWETSIEIDDTMMQFLMNGGPLNAMAQLAVDDPVHSAFRVLDQVDVIQPTLWNWWFVEIINDPTNVLTVGSGGWQRLTIE